MSTLRMKAPVNSTGFSHEGETYLPDDDGIVEIPGHIVPVAVSHGFTPAPEKAASKVLAKAAKGGADETDGTDKAADETVKKGAKAAKGGEQ